LDGTQSFLKVKLVCAVLLFVVHLIQHSIDFYFSWSATSSQSKCEELRCKLYIFDVFVELGEPTYSKTLTSVRDTLLLLLGCCLWLLGGFFLFPYANLLVVAAGSNNLTELRVGPCHSPDSSFVLSKLLRANPSVSLLVNSLHCWLW
jgi:hypothetical protein